MATTLFTMKDAYGADVNVGPFNGQVAAGVQTWPRVRLFMWTKAGTQAIRHTVCEFHNPALVPAAAAEMNAIAWPAWTWREAEAAD